MENKINNIKEDKKEENKPKVVETIIVDSVKPFGMDAPIPTDRNEIKRQLGFKK